MTLASGAAARVGQLQITDANATLTIGGGLSLTLAGSASASQGTIQLAQSSGKFGDLILGAGATLSNDGTLETKGAGAFGASANEIAGGDFVNQGLIEAMTGGLELIGTDIDYRSGRPCGRGRHRSVILGDGGGLGRARQCHHRRRRTRARAEGR